ncbi:MAG TPA: OmpA family protein [Anaeromyxobacteraceae bacterium]
MKRSLALVALLVVTACAGTEAAARRTAEQNYCNPCPMPCTMGCGPAAKAAPPPAPTPPPPPPAPAPVEPAAAPTLSPPAGTYSEAQTVSLSSTTPGAVIHYTTDGSAPTADSPVYTGPFRVEKNANVQAIAIAPGAPASAVSSGEYAITPPPPPPPARVEVTKEKLEIKEKVLFDTGKATIDQRSYSLLDEVADALKAHPEVKSVQVEGHTDNRGSAKLNKKLSQARAEAVRKYLIGKGIEANRLTAKGYGSSRPIADNKTAAGRDANRRVEFVITSR